MILKSFSPALQPYVGDAINPQFGSLTNVVSPGGTKSITVQPPSITQVVTITPPPLQTEAGLIQLPAISQEVVFTPPPVTYSIPVSGGLIRVNPFESVGIVQGVPKRLCALIRPDCIAGAHHYPLTGKTVRFIGTDGFEDAVVVAPVFSKGDLEIYRLDRSINVVKPAAIAPMLTTYANVPFFAFGLVGSRTGDVSQWIPAMTLASVKYAFETSPNTREWVASISNKSTASLVMEPGDSGAPSFFFSNGVATYLGSVDSINLTEWKINMTAPWIAEVSQL